MKFKAPGAAADVPESGEFHSASLAWAEVREDWRGFIEAFPEALGDRVIRDSRENGAIRPAGAWTATRTADLSRDRRYP